MECKWYEDGENHHCTPESIRSYTDWNCISCVSVDATIVVPAEQRDVVRNYMERLVASMLGGSKKDADSDAGSLDRVPIGQLSTSENCTYFFTVTESAHNAYTHDHSFVCYSLLCCAGSMRGRSEPICPVPLTIK